MSMSLTLNHRSCSLSYHDSSRISHSNPSYFVLRPSKEVISSQSAKVNHRKLLRMSPRQGLGLRTRNLLHKAVAISPGTLITDDAIDINDVPLSTTFQVQGLLRRTEGQGETSHTNHSLFQTAAVLNVKPVLQDNLKELYCSVRPECLKFADLGCFSSKPNAAFSPLWVIAETVRKESLRLGQRRPAIQAFLNYLPRNDFNNVFRLLSSFHVKPETDPKEPEFGTCFVAGVPGSFHGRLFPDNSIHFFHSSFTINWLSQVPKRLVSEDERDVNKGNICVAKNSPIRVQGAYSTQFESDFINFLSSRSKEIKPGGRMVIAMMGSNDNKCYNIWELLGMTLNDMVSEGLVEESMLDSFNLPLHSPCREEVRIGVQKEGSFRLLQLETLKSNWDGGSYDKTNNVVGRNKYDNVERGKQMSMTLRDAGESILAAHFGLETADALFRRHSKKVADYLDSVGEGMLTNHVVSLLKD